MTDNQNRKRPDPKKLLLIIIALGVLAAGIVVADICLTKQYEVYNGSRIYTGRLFPRFETDDETSVYSYQSDRIRISVHEYDEYPAHYFAADVWVRDPKDFQCVFSNNRYNSEDQGAITISKDHNALIAINSDFNWGLVIRNGELFSSENWDIPMLMMYRDGKMEINYDQLYSDPEALLRSGVINTWTFGPVLVDNGKNVVNEEADVLAPRTAMGYYSPGHYCFVVVDGRQSGYSSGITLAGLADVMAAMGCRIAYNFDGGASSQMVVEHEYLNNPSLDPPRLHRNMIIIADHNNS